ncbi:MAG: sensor histidine kinase KdpD [Myxococcales bacterium]|nr:sensor histidine kinase KdpD [Myxococcales bacterium]
MMAGDGRPDPDALLKRVQSDEERERRGKLKIFFGFAPGVGKTYSMLASARRLRAHGADVVVGIVETHGRQETASLLDGLESIPRRDVPYRGQRLDEMDLDAILTRRPELVLVDELAHTNAPGSRHQKRWQDVMELLEAGIDVHSTLNVQHVESLNDVVAQITRIQVRETVPDLLLERADEIELVDISPDELLGRLNEGKVYLPDQARRAAEHFFRPGNLLALRELALRRTAQRVDADVRAYRAEQGIQTPWQSSDRILVCVSSSPLSARLIRSARRLSDSLRAPWAAIHVDLVTAPPSGGADRTRLDAHLKLATSLGAEVVRLSGARVASTVLEYARANDVTRIVVGRSTRPRLVDLVRPTVLDQLVRSGTELDVHVISGDPRDDDRVAGASAASRAGSARPTAHTPAMNYVWAGILLIVTTGIAGILRGFADLPDVEMAYLLSIMATAAVWGRGPALLSAALSVAAFDFFFVPPYLTFAVTDRQYLLTFAMMFVVGVAVSSLILRIRRQESDAVRREERTASLYALTRDLGAAADVDAVLVAIARHASEIFDSRATVLLPDESGRVAAPTATGEPTVLGALGATELAAAQWARDHRRVAGLGTDTLPGSVALCAPLEAGSRAIAVLALIPEGPDALPADQRHFLDTFCRQAAFAVERARLAEEARVATLRMRTEELRSALLSAVSHDLRTPLGGITGAATTLRDEPSLTPETRSELIVSICDEAARLERLVSNLLEMTRLASGGLVVRKEWVPVEELVGAAIERTRRLLVGRSIVTDLMASLPMIPVDPTLVEQILVNLLENVARYTPDGSPVTVIATPSSKEPDSVEIAVADRGPGIAPEDEPRLFERFYRGEGAVGRGAGLGLAICRGFVQAHGGTIGAQNRDGGGAIVWFTLPLESASAPALPEEVAGDAQSL